MVVTKVEKRGEIVIIRPIGELTGMSKAQDLMETLDQYLDQDCRSFVIGMADLTQIDSSGMGTLYGLYKKALEAQGKAVFAEIPERLNRILKVMNFHSVVPCVDTVEEAICSLERT